MGNVSKLEVSGHKPADKALTFLEMYSDDLDLESVKIEIVEREQTSRTPAASAKESEPVPKSEDESDEVEEDSVQDDPKRERREIRSGTSHHNVLRAIAELDDGEGVAGSEVKEAVTDVSESSIYPALTELYQRELVNRRRIDDVANPYHEYWVSEWGEKMLTKLDDPEPFERFNDK